VRYYWNERTGRWNKRSPVPEPKPRPAKKTSIIIEGLESSPLMFGEEDHVALESKYQAYLIQLLGDLYPGCFIQKNDSSYTQGIPDLLILFGPRWAMLEVKPSADAPKQPNQDWYVGELNRMSFAAFICPENEEEVLRELEQALRPSRRTRVPVRK
jgi:hypothetical protein